MAELRGEGRMETDQVPSASKQMVLEVFGNCITMLKELEKRELKKSGQSKLKDKTKNLDTQLIILKTQLDSCQDSIRDKVRDEMEASMRNWSSRREEVGHATGTTDEYAAKLLNLLQTGTTDHSKKIYDRKRKQPLQNRRDCQPGWGPEDEPGEFTGQQEGGYGNQDQMLELVFREAQASKQMVLEVFGNCITMLEELENRELKKAGREALPRSDIYLPDQSKFTDTTIQTKLDAQLIMLKAQLDSCHTSIRDKVREEMKASTLNWSSRREEVGLDRGTTDEYAVKLFELLQTGTTDHPREFYERPTIGERDMQKAIGAIMQGNQKRVELDQRFRDDPNRKATGPNLRETAGIDKGADRIARMNPDFGPAVDHYRENQSLL